jgi:hypothetical protein
MQVEQEPLDYPTNNDLKVHLVGAVGTGVRRANTNMVKACHKYSLLNGCKTSKAQNPPQGAVSSMLWRADCVT